MESTTPDTFAINTERFLQWLQKRGVRMSPKMALVDLRAEGRGRGVVATEDFEEDELVFSIPRSATLNVKNAIETRGGDGFPVDGLAAMPNWLSLTTVMMREALSAEPSPWAEYFAVLPSELDSLVFWSPEELSELQASAVAQKIGKDKAEELFRQHLSPFDFKDKLSELHHTASVIMAHAFDIPDDSPEEVNDIGDEEDLAPDDDDERVTLAMIPLADSLNADADRNNARLHSDSEDLEMRAIKPIKKGEEIFNDYGQLPRSDLLRRYGYITDNYAPFDVVEISTSLIVESFKSGRLRDQFDHIMPMLSASEIDARQELAEREDFFEESYDVAYANEDEPGIPDELIALVYIFLVDQPTFSSLVNSESSLSSRSRMATELAGHILKQIFRIREEQYATTLEQDEALLTQPIDSARKAMAIKVRLGEKRVLRAAMQEALTFSGNNKRMRAGKTSNNEVDARPQKRQRMR